MAKKMTLKDLDLETNYFVRRQAAARVGLAALDRDACNAFQSYVREHFTTPREGILYGTSGTHNGKLCVTIDAIYEPAHNASGPLPSDHTTSSANAVAAAVGLRPLGFVVSRVPDRPPPLALTAGEVLRLAAMSQKEPAAIALVLTFRPATEGAAVAVDTPLLASFEAYQVSDQAAALAASGSISVPAGATAAAGDRLQTKGEMKTFSDKGGGAESREVDVAWFTCNVAVSRDHGRSARVGNGFMRCTRPEFPPRLDVQAKAALKFLASPVRRDLPRNRKFCDFHLLVWLHSVLAAAHRLPLFVGVAEAVRACADAPPLAEAEAAIQQWADGR